MGAGRRRHDTAAVADVAAAVVLRIAVEDLSVTPGNRNADRKSLPHDRCEIQADDQPVVRSLVAADDPVPETFNQAEKTYHILKSRMLAMIVRGEFSSIAGERTLDSLSSVRRLCDQWYKSLAWQPATELLNGTPHEAGSENRT